MSCRPASTSRVSRPVSGGDQPERERVRRPEQRQRGEQRRHLRRRATDRREQHRPAGQRDLGEQLAGRRARDERQRVAVARRCRSCAGTSADGRSPIAAYPARRARP